MAITKEMTYGKIRHVMGDQYTITVTLALKDGAATVFTHSVNVDHKTNRTIEASLNTKEVEMKFDKAIKGYLGEKGVADKGIEITNALDILKAKLSIAKVII